MILWTAFLLGFLGSVHCAGMCGPLALVLPAGTGSRFKYFQGRLCYNLGRILTYAALGAVFGLLGHTFALAGLQRWVSLAAGAAILVGLLASPRLLVAAPMARSVNWLKSKLGLLLQRRTAGSLLGIGLLNGLLPCGLVYTACAAATTLGHTLAGVEYMAAFGLGTAPLMLAFSLAGHRLQFALRFKLQRLIPASLLLVGLLLVARGMDLGIPYVSPKLSPAGELKCCH
jgi:sulfite exporter TauE/SafE